MAAGSYPIFPAEALIFLASSPSDHGRLQRNRIYGVLSQWGVVPIPPVIHGFPQRKG